jgi:ferredoxin-NADP reductase
MMGKGEKMAVHQVRLLRNERVAEGTMSFHFSRPDGFTHTAGQSMTMTLTDPPETDSEGNARTFTIASAPYEPELMIATRMRDTAFKRVLKSLAPGATVSIDGPDGEMVLHDDATRPAVFLAGGIGITPFLSMTREAAHRHLPHQLVLFYSNRRPEDAAFLDELQRLQTDNPNYRLVATMSEMSKSSQTWSGETGFIAAGMLKRHLSDVKMPIYYMAGPPPMVEAMHEMLDDIGVSESDVRYEEFFGY